MKNVTKKKTNSAANPEKPQLTEEEEKQSEAICDRIERLRLRSQVLILGMTKYLDLYGALANNELEEVTEVLAEATGARRAADDLRTQLPKLDTIGHRRRRRKRMIS